MINRGVLTEDDPVELLDGVIVQKAPKNPPHCVATENARAAFEAILPAGWFAREEKPITLASSEPEPDLAVCRGMRRDYLERHPGSADLGLVVEIADATLVRDRLLKEGIYAAAGIPWYWLLDLKTPRLEAYSEPRDGVFQRTHVYAAGDAVPVELDGNVIGSISVSDLLPRQTSPAETPRGQQEEH